MVRRPRIGLNHGLQNRPASRPGELPPDPPDPTHHLPQRYTHCVEDAGGLPLGFPIVGPETLRAILDELDGVVLIGGPDVPPAEYGAEPDGSETLMLPARVAFDRALIAALEASDKPVLAICAGHQQLHVARGGTLVQHIPAVYGSAVKHRRDQNAAQAPLHEVRLAPDSRLADILGGTRFETASAHHQAVREPGRGLRSVGWAPDGVLEASEDPDRRFLIAVQWHPEMTREADTTRRLFGAFLEACRHG
jgi:putative glutamine amidotransferase